MFVSNADNTVEAWFDNLQVTHIRGALLDETHYYPYGLPQAGISSTALSFGTPISKSKFKNKEEQSQEFFDGSGLDWLDFGARMYDNQGGRFFSHDRFSEKYYSFSPFNFTLNNPISNLEMNGDSVITDIYDKDGNITSEIPAAVQKAFRSDYGIELQYNAETGMLGGHIIEGATGFSETGQSEWMKHLGVEESKGKIVFGYDMQMDNDTYDGGIAHSGNQVAFIDLADFDNAGNHLSIQYPEGFDRRAFNITRTLDHEFLGHAIKKLSHDFRPGDLYENDPVETTANQIRTELGVIRISYENPLPKNLRSYPYYMGVTFQTAAGAREMIKIDWSRKSVTPRMFFDNTGKKLSR